MKAVLSTLLALSCAVAGAVPSGPHMHEAVSLSKTNTNVKQTPSFTHGELYNLTRHFFDSCLYTTFMTITRVSLTRI